jgi:uncharacterized membrane protein
MKTSEDDTNSECSICRQEEILECRRLINIWILVGLIIIIGSIISYVIIKTKFT